MVRFIATQELGRLSRRLRMMGFDVSSYRGCSFGGLIVEALREERTVLTRTHRVTAGLEKNTIVIFSDQVQEQLRQVAKTPGFVIEESKFFTRCALCNEEFVMVDKESVKEKIPAYVYANKEIFVQCPVCQKVYWHGSHVTKIKKIFSQFI